MQSNIGFGDIAQLMLRYKRSLLLILGINIVWSLCFLSYPFLTRALVDNGIQHDDFEIVVIVLVSQFLLFLAIQLSDITRQWLLRHIGVRIGLTIILDFFKIVLRKPLSFFNISEQGKTIQQFNDNLRVEAFLTTDSSQFVDSFLKVILFGVLLFLFDTQIGIILVVSTVLIWIAVMIFLKARAVIDHNRFEMSSSIRSEIVDIYKGIIDLKSNNQEAKRLNNWDQLQSKYSNVRLNSLRMILTIDNLAFGIAQTRDILILFFAAKATIYGSMTLGTLLAIQYILGQLRQPIDRIALFVTKWQDTKLSLERINKIIDIKDDERYDQHLPMPTGQGLDIKDLSFEYKEGYPILKDVNMSIPLGKKIALIGESGSGKSTLMKLIVGLLPYTKGNILLGRTEVKHINLNAWLKGCSIVLQDSVLFNRSIWYNITFEDEIEQAAIIRVNECLDLCLVRDVIERCPQHFNAIPSKDINMSRGQLQRLLLARALYKDAEYILLDEPFSALDGPTYRKILKNISPFIAHKTLIIVTHKLGVAQSMDHIYLMHEGRIIEEGSHESLMEKGEKYVSLIKEEDES